MTASRRDSSALIRFYQGQGQAFRGRGIEDVWRMSLDELEYAHDYIQWLFPLREPSAFNPDAPILDAEAVEAFHSAELQTNLARSSDVMARFYGFVVHRAGDAWRIERGPDFIARSANWLTPRNHNLLRMTRIMKSLHALGLSSLARAWFDALSDVYRENAATIGAETMRYWSGAVAG